MAISAGAQWRVRIGGSDTLCSGLFDPTVSGAGTDYTDQDTAQLAITDLACAGTPWTTLTSATGGFTSAMIGNGIYIASGTNFTAGRYIITGVTNTNTITVDRAAGATGACSSGVAKIGGAVASAISITGAAHWGAVAGNVVYIRGQGLNVPVGIDYNWGVAATNVGAGLSYIGYNGRPCIGHTGRIWAFSTAVNAQTLENLYFTQTAATYTTHGVVSGTTSNNSLAYNCVFDQAGFDASQLQNMAAIRCSFINSGTQTIGTRPIINQDVVTGRYITYKNCLFKDLRYSGIAASSGQVNIDGNVFQNLGSDAITLASESYLTSAAPVTNNTIYNCAGHGIAMTSNYNNFVFENLITNITGSGKYGIYVSNATNSSAAVNSATRVARNNFYGNTNNCNVNMASSNTTLDPQYTSAPTDLTPTNTSLRVLGGVGAL